MAWNSTPAIPSSACNISPRIRGIFGTSRLGYVLRRVTTKGILFTKRCWWSWIQLQISTKNLTSHHLCWKKTTVQERSTSPSFRQIPGQNPTKRIGKKKKISPQEWWWSIGGNFQRCFLSEAQHIHSRLCKNMAPRILEKRYPARNGGFFDSQPWGKAMGFHKPLKKAVFWGGTSRGW